MENKFISSETIDSNTAITSEQDRTSDWSAERRINSSEAIRGGCEQEWAAVAVRWGKCARLGFGRLRKARVKGRVMRPGVHCRTPVAGKVVVVHL